MNVVIRPTQKTGKGYDFSGHHEIMIPLLAALVNICQASWTNTSKIILAFLPQEKSAVAAFLETGTFEDESFGVRRSCSGSNLLSLPGGRGG